MKKDPKANQHTDAQNTEKEEKQQQDKLHQLSEQIKRVQADYQNLQRRTYQEKQQAVKFANQDLLEDLLQPLEHLSLAARELQNQGLDMVVAQLWNVLEAHGLKEISVLGKPFDVTCMEAVEAESAQDSETGVVTAVIRKGYSYQDKVLQHAKVSIGSKKDKKN